QPVRFRTQGFFSNL
ncbi:autotransporter beta-domain protein, partial [Chlamydia psittaci C1/97]